MTPAADRTTVELHRSAAGMIDRDTDELERLGLLAAASAKDRRETATALRERAYRIARHIETAKALGYLPELAAYAAINAPEEGSND